jgi:Tol biopolymer transport system component
VRDPISPYGWSCSSAWLPNGKAVIVDGLKLVSLETGESRPLITPSGAPLTGWYPAVRLDGTVAYARPSSMAAATIYLVGVSRDGHPVGEPRRVAPFEGDIWGIAWTASGRDLVFAGGNLSGRSGISKVLWRVPAIEGAQPVRLPFGEDAIAPAISPAGGRIAFVRTLGDVNIWRARLQEDGTTLPAPERFVSSTRSDWNPQYSPDGRRLAFESTRTGQSAIWVGNADGSNLVQVFSRAGRHAGSPRWAPDSQRLAFDSTAEGDFDVYVIRVGSERPRRITTDAADDVMPSWSPDGRWIYFASNRTGRQEVWRVPASGGEAAQVTRNGGACVYASADGTRIYYTKQDGDAPLWSMPVTGGPETQVLPSVVSRAFAVFADGVYFVPRADLTGRHAVHYLSFASGVAAPVVPLAAPVTLGLTVSPDRRSVLYVQTDMADRDVMLVDGFR